MSAPALIQITTNNLPAVWPVIRPRIEAMREKFAEQWMVEHVFYELMQGGTYLWTTGDLRGFVVLQILATPYARDLHVWIADNQSGVGVREFFEQLGAIAVEHNCGHVTWETDRLAWARVFPEARVRQRFSVPAGG